MSVLVFTVEYALRVWSRITDARYSGALAGRLRFADSGIAVVDLIAIMVSLLVVSASVMCYAEHEAQPEAFPNIPASLWWTVVTLTTVVYGDAFPVTGLGKFLASVISILGIGMFALPTGILGAGFVEEIQKCRQMGEVKRCPHCGRELE